MPSESSDARSWESLAHSLAENRRDAILVARRLVGAQEAEDVVQEAIVRVLGSAARGRAIEDPRAYMRATVRHVASDHLRSARVESLTGEIPERGSRYADPQTGAELRELLAGIECLPDRQRVALLNTALATGDQRDLAELLNTTSAGVRQLVRRARQRLRDTLAAWIPGLAGRVKALTGTAGAAGAAHAAAATVAVVTVLAITTPTPPRPPHPPTPATPSLGKALRPQVQQPRAPHTVAPARPNLRNP